MDCTSSPATKQVSPRKTTASSMGNLGSWMMTLGPKLTIGVVTFYANCIALPSNSITSTTGRSAKKPPSTVVFRKLPSRFTIVSLSVTRLSESARVPAFAGDLRHRVMVMDSDFI